MKFWGFFFFFPLYAQEKNICHGLAKAHQITAIFVTRYTANSYDTIHDRYSISHSSLEDTLICKLGTMLLKLTTTSKVARTPYVSLCMHEMARLIRLLRKLVDDPNAK